MVVITIDGPSGAGKSTSARLLARRLGFDFLDTGAMYRAVTWTALRRQCPLDDESALEELCAQLDVSVNADNVFVNAEKIPADELRDPKISQAASPVSAFARVRQHLVRWQQAHAQGRDIVTEGRDQGSVVFPNATCKFYLDADPRVRAQRRFEELQKRGVATLFEQILREQMERDALDASRPTSPLRRPEDAVVIDSTSMDLEHVVTAMEREVRRRLS